METLNEQINTKATGDETLLVTSLTKSHNPGLRALMALKNLAATQEKDYSDLLKSEGDLNELNITGLQLIEANASSEAITQWKENLLEVNNALSGIKDTLTAAKEKIEKKVKDGFPELWKQLTIQVSALKNKSKNAANLGFYMLPEAIHPQWEKEFVKPETQQTQSIVSHVDSSRVLLQMIERYTPDELNAITQIIIDKIPLDFTYEEAVEYQNDYYKALVNFKAEFKEKKNLWDKFLDILAGGTHQPPSERIMMERWLEGEKGELI